MKIDGIKRYLALSNAIFYQVQGKLQGQSQGQPQGQPQDVQT
jgi:hypothetical protein